MSRLTRQKPTKKPVSIYMTTQEHRGLIALSKRTETPYSVLVRKLVAAYGRGEIVHHDLPRVAAAAAPAAPST